MIHFAVHPNSVAAPVMVAVIFHVAPVIVIKIDVYQIAAVCMHIVTYESRIAFSFARIAYRLFDVIPHCVAHIRFHFSDLYVHSLVSCQ